VRFDAFDAFFSVYDEYQPLKRGKPTPGSPRRGRAGGARAQHRRSSYGSVTFDEWGINGNAALRGQRPRRRRARRTVLTCTPRWRRSSSRRAAPRGVAPVRDRITGGRTSSSRAGGGELHRRVEPHHRSHCAGLEGKVKVRPGKGVHLMLDRPITDVG
jgi:hypothetical protein